MRKTILITGASNGFGNDAAKALAAAGHRVTGEISYVDGGRTAGH